MAITFRSSRSELYERSPGGYLLGNGLVLAVIGAAILTDESYLRGAIVASTSRMIVVAAVVIAALLLLRLRKLGVPHAAGRSPLFIAAKVGGLTLVASVLFASACVLALEIALLVVVKYGPATPVEFNARVTRVFSITKKCQRMIEFANEPLARDASVCANDYRLDALRPGDGIVVQERVGRLGGTIVSVHQGLPAVVLSNPALGRIAHDFCGREGKKPSFKAGSAPPYVVHGSDGGVRLKFWCE